MLQELELHVQRREDFGFESTLSGQTYLSLLRRVKETGYILRFYYLWVASVDLALKRIKARVMEGGHDVPEADVRRR